jgi:hypothetical protein
MPRFGDRPQEEPENLEPHATRELEDPWLGQTRPGAPLQWEQCSGQADEAKRNSSVRATQTLGSTQKTSPMPRLVGYPPAVTGGLSCFNRQEGPPAGRFLSALPCASEPRTSVSGFLRQSPSRTSISSAES